MIAKINLCLTIIMMHSMLCMYAADSRGHVIRTVEKRVRYTCNGMHVGSITYHLQEQKKMGYISMLEVDPQFRQKGFGSCIVWDALHDLKQQGCTHVELAAAPIDGYTSQTERNQKLMRLVQFYMSSGFVVKQEHATWVAMKASL